MQSATDLFAAMASWAQAQGDRTDVTVKFRAPSTTYPKNLASVELETADAVGTVTIWDSGECETDVMSKTDPDRHLIRTGEVSTAADVVTGLDSAIAFALQLPQT